MSSLDRYWNFKLILKDTASSGRSADVVEEDFSQGPISVPFVSAASRVPTHQTADTLKEFTGLNDTMELMASKVDLNDSSQPPPEVQQPQDRPEVQEPLVEPTPVELDELSLKELRNLRRKLAVEFHPDGARGRTIGDLGRTMGRCNRLIDEAISRKNLLINGS